MKTPSTPSNSHYHINLICVSAAEPHFCPKQLIVPDDVREQLSVGHISFLFTMLGLEL